MVDYTQYPNPLRLFSQTRDVWFQEFVEGHGVPMHVFAALRETQLGQLMYAIEDVRLKKVRSGEDPGPGMLEGENLDMFVPMFNTIKQLRIFRVVGCNISSGLIFLIKFKIFP